MYTHIYTYIYIYMHIYIYSFASLEDDRQIRKKLIYVYISGVSPERVLYPVPSLRSTGWKPKTPCFAARRHPARPPASHARGDERAG